ncbi:MAG: internalization-related competence protein ComEC/Rec2, partial [Bacteroidetes bacterium]|nr:internalization-related competence protein ComEC/Rec2 [Bacteroidota bacterium]
MSTFRLSTSPAFRVALLAIVGILIRHWLDLSLAVLVPVLFLLTILVGICFLLESRFHSLAQIVNIAVVLLCVLCAATKLALDTDRAVLLPDSIFSRNAIVIGTIAEPPVTTTKVTRFVMKVHEIRADGGAIQIRENVRVSITRPRTEQRGADLEYGMVLALQGRLSRPSDSRNPGDFSEKQYYEANGITMFMLVRGAENIIVLDSTHASWLMSSVVVPARKYVLRVLDATTGGESAEFLKGLMIGERSGISSTTRQAFTNSGVAHVLAVSGSNVVVVAGIFFFLFGLLRFPKWAVVVSSVVMITLYMLVTGSQPPVVRATITASIFLIASLAQVKSNPFNSLGIAALIILTIDARQLFDVGFQLSFTAVLSIIYLYQKMNVWISGLGSVDVVRKAIVWTLRVCAVSLAASLGTLPLTAVYFGKVSIIGLLANIFVIPAVGASVVLGFITVVASLFSDWIASSYAAVNQLLLDSTLWLIRLAGNSSLAYVDTSRFLPVYSLPFYAALLLLFNIGVRSVARKLLIILLICLNVAVFIPPPVAVASTGRLRVNFLDVGQGDAAVVELPDGKVMVVDAGPASAGYDSGERIVAPFLRRRGISRIDMLVVTHPHDDHLGGVPFILEQFEVAEVLESGQPTRSSLYRKYVADVQNERCAVDTARRGMPIIRFGNMRLYVIFPTTNFIDADTTRR